MDLINLGELNGGAKELDFIQLLPQIFCLEMLIALVVGCAVGYFVGAMPGIGGGIGITLLIPFTYSMRPDIAIVMMTAIYMTSEYANAIPAIAINTPGTSSAVATCFDGYPMAQNGYITRAISYSLNASVVGGLMGIFALIIFAQPLVYFALKFGAGEYFALGTIGIVLIASMRGKNSLKSIISGLFGFWLSLIGVDMLTGQIRFNFGTTHLMERLSLIPVIIGLLAFPEIIKGVESWKKSLARERETGVRVLPVKEDDGYLPMREILKYKFTILRAGIIGIVIGVIPGVGASIASLLGYEVEKKSSKYPHLFGTGVPEGIIAAETSNNSVVAGALIPTLTLGIPGSVQSAIIMVIFMIHGIVPGPQLYNHSRDLVYVIYAGLILGVFVMWLMGRVTLRHIGIIKKIPFSIIVPVVLVLCYVGAFSLTGSIIDANIAFGLGLVGYFMKKNGFLTAPAVIGMVLGSMTEVNFRRAVLQGHGGYSLLFGRPIALTILIIAAASLVWALWSEHKAKKMEAEAANTSH